MSEQNSEQSNDHNHNHNLNWYEYNEEEGTLVISPEESKYLRQFSCNFIYKPKKPLNGED